MTAHAACSPSSANMWLACPASVTKTKDMTRPSSKFAREGTAAHAVAEMTLKGDIFLPDKITVEGDEYVVSPGMCRALNLYVTFVQAMSLLPNSTTFLEARLHVPDTDGMVWGTLDCGIHAPEKPALIIADLKYGKGHVVDPDSPQLKLYALALAGHVKENDAGALVDLAICQPRAACDPLRHLRRKTLHVAVCRDCHCHRLLRSQVFQAYRTRARVHARQQAGIVMKGDRKSVV